MTTWYSATTPEQTDRLLAAWSDAPIEDLELCNFLLDVARMQVEEFAPAIPDSNPIVDAFEEELGTSTDTTAEVPFNLVYAQLVQAQNLWNAGRAQSDGGVGSEGYSFTPRPLDKTVRSIIRPTSGVPRVF